MKEVPGVGHGALGTSWCVDDIVTRFLAEPLDEVGAACLADLGEPLFTTR
jgi:hypothetical protein